MDHRSLALVLAAIVAHGYWNFLIKRSGGGQIFIGLSKVAELLVFAPVFLIWFLPAVREHSSAWPIVVVGAALSLANYVALGKAYQVGDLSLVYPVSRGAILLFLPLFGFFAFGERPSLIGWIAIACIMVGILVMPLVKLDGSSLKALGPLLRHSSIGYALVAALAAATYTVWDKRAVMRFPVFAYFYSYTVLVALAYAGYLWKRHPAAAVRDELRRHWWPIVQVGVLNTVAYWLILVALRTGVSTYIVALRQLSIAFGALLGWRLLDEPIGPAKRLGLVLIVVGCVLVAVGG